MSKHFSVGISTFDSAEYLKDEESIAEYLNASIEMNDPGVLHNAVSVVARARKMTEVATAAGLGRESLYKALKPGASPRYDTFMKVLGALGVEMVFRAPVTSARRSKSAYPKFASKVTVKKAPAVAAKKAAPAKKRAPRRAPGDVRALASDTKKAGRKGAPSIRG